MKNIKVVSKETGKTLEWFSDMKKAMTFASKNNGIARKVYTGKPK